MYADGRGYAPSPGGSRLPPSLSSPSGRVSFPKSLSDKYRLGEELGRGAFGQVYLGLDTRTGEHVAIKQLSLERIPTENLQGIMNEVELLKALNHRNIVKYIGSFKTKTHLYIILEFMENGALSSVIKQSKFGPFPESLVAVYIQQVLQGLAYLHDQGVVHRDIKGANILTTKEGLVKLADFGVAAKLAELEAEAQAGGERGANPVGTPYWMAPEVVEMQSVSTASDIWSVGCLAVELLTGSPPYYDLQPMSALYNIVQDPHPPLPADISSGMRDFLLRCFHKDPAARPSARELLQHNWITYNRRTLKSSWNRTRGLKTRAGGPLAEGYTSVSTVVERILQSAADSEGGTAGTAAAAPGSTAGAAAAAAASTAAGSAAGLAGPDSLTLYEQTRSQAAAAGAHGAILGNAAALAPVAAAAGARQSAFSVPAVAAGTGQPSSAGPSSPGGTAVQGTWGAKLPQPPVFPGGAEQQQQQQQGPGSDLFPGAAGPRHRRLWSGAVAGPPPLGGTLDARPQQAAQAPPAEQAQQAQQDEEAETALSSSDDACGELLLERLEASLPGNVVSPARARSSSGGGGAWPGSVAKPPSLATVAENDALAVEASAQSRHEVAEVKRQVAGMRILVFAAGERSFVQEAAAAASCRTLLGLLSRDPQLRAAFLAAEGLSALRELLDNPSDRVLEAALDLLLLLAAADGEALSGCCRLGFIPAVLRFALPSTPIDLRLQAAAFAELLCRSSSASAQQVVACQGVPFIRDMIDEQQQLLHPQQFDLAAIAVSCFWLLLRRTQQPGWPLSLNQLLRLYAHHNLPLRLVRLLPRLLQAHQQAAAAAAEAQAATPSRPAPTPVPAPRHARTFSMPQSEAELTLLGNDELAATAASLALTRGAGEDAGSGSSGHASPERSSSPSRRWLGRALPSSPSRLSRMHTSRPPVGSPDRTLDGAAGPAAAAAPPVPPQVEAEQRLTQLVDSLINLLAAMAHGDSSVKARLCQREVLAGMMGLAGHLRPHLQLRVLRWVRQLATDQLVLQALEEAGAVAYVVAQLRQPEQLGLQADALGALHCLCQLSRSRQELAAEHKAVAPLVQLVQQPPPAAPVPVGAELSPGAAAAATAAAAAAAAAAASRGLAVSLLCGFAHGGPRSRQELWGAGGFDTLVELLKEEPHQVAAIDALVAWLEAEPPRVEARLLDREALDRLVMLLPAGTAAAAAASPGGDSEQLQSLLASLIRLLQRSPRLAVELAQNGLAARVVELLKRPGATAALSLLQMLRAMYEHHPRPKEFIVKYRVQQTLAALAHGQSAANQASWGWQAAQGLCTAAPQRLNTASRNCPAAAGAGAGC